MSINTDTDNQLLPPPSYDDCCIPNDGPPPSYQYFCIPNDGPYASEALPTYEEATGLNGAPPPYHAVADDDLEMQALTPSTPTSSIVGHRTPDRSPSPIHDGTQLKVWVIIVSLIALFAYLIYVAFYGKANDTGAAPSNMTSIRDWMTGKIKPGNTATYGIK